MTSLETLFCKHIFYFTKLRGTLIMAEFCPMNPQFYEEGGKMELLQVEAITSHIAAPSSCSHPQLKELIFKDSLQGTTPLLLACADGDLSAVEHIIGWGVDVNASATYYPSLYSNYDESWPRGIEGATPLFVAAVYGHLDIVKYLCDEERGAVISLKTKSDFSEFNNLTALCGALMTFDGIDSSPISPVESPLREKKIEILRFLLSKGADPSAHSDQYHRPWRPAECDTEYPTWMMNLSYSDVNAVSELIGSGMCLEMRNPRNGSTVLHHWVSNRHWIRKTADESPLDVVKLLARMGVDFLARDENGFSPLLLAARGFLAESSRESFDIFNYLLERQEIDLEEKIDACELIGAVILSNPENAHLFHHGFDYWRQAQHLRRMGVEGNGPVPKNVMQRRNGLTVEWNTDQELEDVIQRPSNYPIHALLVKLRIYSRKTGFKGRCWEMVNFFYRFLNSFCDDVPLLKEQLDPATLLEMLCAILENILTIQLSYIDFFFCGIPGMVVREIIELLPNFPMLTSEVIRIPLQLMVAAEQYVFDFVFHDKEQRYFGDEKKNEMLKFLDLVTVITSNPDEVNKRLLMELFRLKSTTYNGRFLLHNSFGDYYSNLSTVRFILKCGVDPNLGDTNGNGPLHHLLRHGDEWELHKRDDYAILRLFLDFGGRLDRKNNDGKTPLDLWTEFQINNWNQDPEEFILDRLPDWCYLHLPRLKVLSARAVRSNDIPITEEIVPATLCKFVKDQEMQ